MRTFFGRAFAPATLLFAFAVGASPAAQAQLAYSGGYTQDFDSLASAAGTTSTELPAGWALLEAGNNANATYGVDNGGSNSGNTFSYGSTGSSERALGALLSGSLNSRFGVLLSNQTGSTLTSLPLSYTGEQWRLGTVGRVDRLDLQIGVGATGIADAAATWVDVDSLDFTAPVTAGTVGALDGNAVANRTLVSGEISGISIAPGQSFALRWVDLNASSNDDGLAIDDVLIGSLTDNSPVLLSTQPEDAATGVPSSQVISLQFSEPVELDSAQVVFTCGGNAIGFSSNSPASLISLTPTAALPFSSSCVLDIPAAAVVDRDGTPDPLGSAIALSFQTAADVPPSLLSTVPTQGASNVATSQTVQLNFSEAVDVATAQIIFVCNSQPVAFSSNSPASAIVLTPNSALPNSASCAVNVPASAVTDRDGTPDPLGAPVALSFSTVADLPPQLLTSTPANGATGVAPAVTPSLQFSETVTLAAAAFSLECDAGGAIGMTYPTSGQNITLSPQALLQEGDRCDLRLVAAAITDSAGQPLPANVLISFETSKGAGDYYAQVNTSSPEQLRCSLHATIRGHTSFPYSGSGTSTWTILELAEEDPNDSTRIIDGYRNRKFVKGSDRAGTGGGITYNREHSWPNSLGFGSTTGNLGLPNAPYTDTHMLYLTDTGYNADRGNMPYANCAQSSGCGERVTEVNNGIGGGSGQYPGNSNWFQGPNGNQGSFEVWGARKGDFARTILYMAIRYEGGVHPGTGQSEPDLELTDNRSQIVITSSSPAYMGLLTDLLQWHQADPPDAAEVRRNDVVQSYQGNRNPFIDHPEWGTRALFTSARPSTCELVTPVENAIFSDGFEATLR
jgi:endonuclease I/methionine-rich copper-binding protein CopC